MHAYNLIRDCGCYNELCIHYRNFGMYEQVFELFEEMRKNSIEEDLESYHIMIQSYGNFKEWEKCLEIWKKLVSSAEGHPKPNKSTVYAMLKASYESMNFEEGIEFFNAVVEKKEGFDPIIYKIAIQLYSHVGDWSSVINTVHFLRENGVSLDSTTVYNNHPRLRLPKGHKKAEFFFDFLHQNGIKV
eukprot:CAMPEP_0171469602 /NCGR_PEP_ID=MMETSP0945-20130129/11390_1 /TAXON_ID=109269 /ORGANISM="Vaucheria litorea, Strain CCMP2940" /LENGTH=186 /DNA_ID=CAMNT_0011998793 /DNA_START=124 /DNA_END=681 /DNA_ORIENTATION=+